MFDRMCMQCSCMQSDVEIKILKIEEWLNEYGLGYMETAPPMPLHDFMGLVKSILQVTLKIAGKKGREQIQQRVRSFFGVCLHF